MGKKKKRSWTSSASSPAGMKDNGYSDEAIKALWDVMLPFSGYAFNKSHTAGYGLVSYWTAYLKANYPAEYMAALLTSVGDDKDKAPSTSPSAAGWASRCYRRTSTSPSLQFAAVGEDDPLRTRRGPNVGENAWRPSSTSARRARTHDFNDFLTKVPLAVCNKRHIESLIKAGAFDWLDHPRKG